MRGTHGEIFATVAVVVFSLAVAVGGGNVPDQRRPVQLAPAGNACPLTPVQEQRAIEAFEKMMPVVTHPRCLNCHGGIDPYAEPTVGGHIGGKMTLLMPFEETLKSCQDCHDGLPGWDRAASQFVGKGARELCMMFKQFPHGAEFVGHIFNDNNGVQFIAAAFAGDRALNDGGKLISEDETGRPFVNQPPPGTHDELVETAQEWVNALGAGWPVKRDCGCMVRGAAWVGSITTTSEMTTEMGVIKETTNADVVFEVDSTFLTPGETAIYWKSTSGAIRWRTEMSGQCQAHAAGTTPIGKGGDDNWMAMLREEIVNGKQTYSVAIGPWQDHHYPSYVIRCPNQPPIPGLLYNVAMWWNHEDAGIISPDGRTLNGTYTAPWGPTGKATWRWSLTLQSGSP